MASRKGGQEPPSCLGQMGAASPGITALGFGRVSDLKEQKIVKSLGLFLLWERPVRRRVLSTAPSSPRSHPASPSPSLRRSHGNQRFGSCCAGGLNHPHPGLRSRTRLLEGGLQWSKSRFGLTQHFPFSRTLAQAEFIHLSVTARSENRTGLKAELT